MLRHKKHRFGRVLGLDFEGSWRGLGRSWGRLGASWAPLTTSWAQLWLQSTIAIVNIKKIPKNGPPKTRGRRHETLCVGLGWNVEFSKNLVQNLVFLHFFQNSPNMAPVKGGFGGSPNDIFDVMQGNIYAYILCMALACRMYYDIYILRRRQDDSQRRSDKPCRPS